MLLTFWQEKKEWMGIDSYYTPTVNHYYHRLLLQITDDPFYVSNELLLSIHKISRYKMHNKESDTL